MVCSVGRVHQLLLSPAAFSGGARQSMREVMHCPSSCWGSKPNRWCGALPTC
jgi:hypothetical protein